MPSRTRTTGGKVTVRTQRNDASHEAGIKLAKMVMPWMAWAGLTVFVNLLYLGLWLRARDALTWTGLGALFIGALVAVFDARLRSHRASWEGRWIGPVTAFGTGLATCLYLSTGIGPVRALAYLFGGLTACIVWDIWLTVGDHRDFAATFTRNAGAAGAEGAEMVELSRRPVGTDADDPVPARAPRRPRGTGRARPRPARQEVVEVGLMLPSDPAMTAEEVSERLGHFEVVTGSPPGSLALVTDPSGAGMARVRKTPPDLLTRAPIAWPGPSAPGADMSEPFRLAMLQTGEWFRYPRLPISHLRVTGKTGSAKTMGLAWNMLAEGITRQDYAAFVADPAKGEQFMGALRPALHQLVLDEEEIHLFLARLHKARLDRCNYLGRNRHTEWFPGCGLVFMECWLEEAAEILKLLGTTKADRRDGLYALEDWAGDVNTGRSAGMSWTTSYQRPDKNQARDTTARSQMGYVCFAVSDKKDYEFGLSELQRERGCRPTLWDRPDAKAMAYFDAETVDEETKVTPMRFANWGPGSVRIAAYASEYQARDRPLDDVTGAAMSWTPPVSPTSAVLPARTGTPPRSYDSGGLSPKKRSMLEAEEKTRQVIERWRADGRESFIVEDLNELSAVIGKGRTWFYSTLPKMAAYWRIAKDDSGGKTRWIILPAELHAVDDPQDDAPDQEDIA